MNGNKVDGPRVLRTVFQEKKSYQSSSLLHICEVMTNNQYRKRLIISPSFLRGCSLGLFAQCDSLFYSTLIICVFSISYEVFLQIWGVREFFVSTTVTKLKPLSLILRKCPFKRPTPPLNFGLWSERPFQRKRYCQELLTAHQALTNSQFNNRSCTVPLDRKNEARFWVSKHFDKFTF